MRHERHYIIEIDGKIMHMLQIFGKIVIYYG